MLPRELGQRKHGAGAGAFAAGADQDDDGVLLQERFHFAPGFRQGFPGHVRIVPGAEAAGRPRADQQSFLGRHIGQRELVGVEEARRHRGPQSFRVTGIGLLGDREVLLEQRLDRPENVAAATARAQEKESHRPPASLVSTLNRKGTTTHRPRAYGRLLTNACSLSAR